MNCFPMFKRIMVNKPKEHSVHEEETSQEYQADAEILSDDDISDDDEETPERLSGWDQYHMWVRKRMLDKWSAQAEERKRLGRPPKDTFDDKDIMDMLMFGLASREIKPTIFG